MINTLTRAATLGALMIAAAFANPALDLITRGSMGMTISEPIPLGSVVTAGLW